jgi:GNAT superfamily N-acetyltransferase
LVQLLVTYLEMSAAPQGPALSPPIEGGIVERESVDEATYLALYRAIGAPLQWDLRLRMAADELQSFLTSPAACVYVLRLAGRAVGLCEFDRLGEPDIELVHFGLIPDAQGKRLGPYLLDRALRLTWTAHVPRRVWLHTDTNDHPKALSVYRRAGFQAYAQRVETFPD